MKAKIIFLFSVVAALCFSQKNVSAASNNNRELLKDIAEITAKCVVRPYVLRADGKKDLMSLTSICEEVSQVSNKKVVVEIEGERFLAVLSESTDSDGGDLDDLLIYDSHKRLVADRKNVLAFDEIFVAMTGGKDNFKEVEQR